MPYTKNSKFEDHFFYEKKFYNTWTWMNGDIYKPCFIKEHRSKDRLLVLITDKDDLFPVDLVVNCSYVAINVVIEFGKVYLYIILMWESFRNFLKYPNYLRITVYLPSIFVAQLRWKLHNISKFCQHKIDLKQVLYFDKNPWNNILRQKHSVKKM
jgi:hypothetical protein